jgi:ABC-type polysaccharide/polyol phosphate transport system ATPase subunit
VIKSLCDRAIWIENGVVQEIGPAVEVIEMYEKFVIGHPVVSR